MLSIVVQAHVHIIIMCVRCKGDRLEAVVKPVGFLKFSMVDLRF